MKFSFSQFILQSLIFLWISLVVLPPIFFKFELENIARYMYVFFSTICHQNEYLSYHFLGEKIAVCSRCFAIYFSFFIGTFFYSLKIFDKKKISFPYVFIFAIPMCLDFLFGNLNLYFGLKTVHEIYFRPITGSIFGFAIAIPLLPLMNDTISQILNKIICKKNH